MYASVEDMREEGVSTEDASDKRTTAALLDACSVIDKATGWFFEPRDMGFVLSGRQSPVLELPVPPIQLTQIRVGSAAQPPAGFTLVGAPVLEPAFHIPKIIWHERAFPSGTDNIWVQGRWGYTVPQDGNPDGATPRQIRRATLLLAKQFLPRLGSEEAVQERSHWRLVEERTRDQSYRLEPRADGPLTGNPEVDALLLPYRRPQGMGAA